MKRRPYSQLALLVACMAALPIGCSRQEKTADIGGPPVTVTKTLGPVTLTLSAAPGEPQALSPLRIRVEGVASTGVALSPQDYAQTLRAGICRFDCRIIRASVPRSPALEGDRLRWLQEVEIEFLLAGDYELPPVQLSFTDAQAVQDAAQPDVESAKPKSQEIKTDPLAVKVAPPPEGELAPEQLQAIKTLDPVELPTRWSKWWWLGPILAVAAAAILALLVYLLAQVIPPLQHLLTWMRRRWTRMVTPPPVPPIPAHEWASREFARLLAENLVSSGRIREFYFRLSDIVRGYIERRFDVSAPEMTTEEFLAEVSHDRRFGHKNTLELQHFLAACDLVKYAGFRPDPDDAEGLTRAAMDFVERTRTSLAVEMPPAPSELTEEAA